MSLVRTLVFLGGATLLSGCHYVSARLNPDCHQKQEYQHSREVAALKVPDGMDNPNT